MLSVLRKSDQYTCCECQLFEAPSSIVAAPNHGGQLGYIHMPNAVAVNYERRLGDGLYLNGTASLLLQETVSSVKQAPNSKLPHGRSDMAQHLRGGRFSLRRILLNRYDNRLERSYRRLSTGLNEDMFCGSSVDLPENSRWAADVAVDALQQRGFKGLFDSRGYKTVTAIGSLHDRLPHDITVTAPKGLLMVKDNDVRLELKRRFQSGIEVGTWYTHIEGKKRSDAFFQSDHAAIAFAAVTPFAGEYDAPWLYSVAVLGSAGRVADKYWMSDTDAGDIPGHAVGGRLRYAQCNQNKSSRSINLDSKRSAPLWQAAH